MRRYPSFLLLCLVVLLSCREKGTPPPPPLEVAGFVETPGYAKGIHVKDSILYVACGEAGVVSISLEDPESPFIIGEIDWFQQDVAQSIYTFPWDTFLYLADMDDGIVILSASKPESLEYVSFFWSTNVISLHGSQEDTVICALDQRNGLRVLDPKVVYGNLVELGLPLSLPATPYGVFVMGNLCLIADGQLGLQIADIEDPQNKKIVGYADTPGKAMAVYAVDSLCFVADGYEGISVIDITDPTSPGRIYQLDLSGFSRGVALKDTLLAVACGSAGVALVNVSDPLNPSLIHQRDISYTYDVAFYQDYLVAATRRGIYTIRIH